MVYSQYRIYSETADVPNVAWFSVRLGYFEECSGGYVAARSTCESMFRSIISGCTISAPEWESPITVGGTVVDGCGIYDLRV
jgi:hypothetical protein